MRTKLVTLFLISVIALLMAAPVLANDEQPELLPEEIFEELGFPVEPSIPGRIEGAGTYFEIKDSEYLNITLESTREIDVILESISDMIRIFIQPNLSALSTLFTIKGLEPNTTYFKYEDDYHNLKIINTDEYGAYSYIQDISTPHIIFIQPKASTKFIRDNSNGGDCYLIGNWDNLTKTCTLTEDINETIQIDNDNIILNGNNHTIAGSFTGSGIYLYARSNIVIENLKIKNFTDGISIFWGGNNLVENNVIFYNYVGLNPRSTDNNIVRKNTISNNTFGIWLGWYLFPYPSLSNQFYNNNFIDNNISDFVVAPAIGTIFYFPPPIGGNYWSKYDTPEEGCDDLNNDNFCDSPYNFYTENTDNYPWTKQDGWLNQSPSIINSGQFKSDGIISINEGETTIESTIVFKATLNDSDNDQVKLQVEIKESNQLFDELNLLESSFVPSGSEISLTKEGLIDSQYHWRARAIDDKDNSSGWQEFGEIGNVDFEVKLVPLYTQVRSPYPSWEETEEWFDDRYGVGNYSCFDKELSYSTIRSCGCAITSEVMLLRFHGVTATVDSKDVNPGTFNKWLTNNKGYWPNGGVKFEKIQKYSKDESGFARVVYDGPIRFKDNFTLDLYLNEVKPVILYESVLLQGQPISHFIVADGRLANTYTVRDPAWYNTRYLSQSRDSYIQNYGNNFYGLRLFSPALALRGVDSISLNLASPAELLVTDPRGRKLGKDPISNIEYNEIPNSSYYQEGIGNPFPETPTPTKESKFIWISNPVDGRYDIQVIGTDSGRYTMGFLIYDQTGQSEEIILEGNTETNNIQGFELNYSHYTIQEIEIYRIVDIDIKPGSYPDSINLGSAGITPVVVLTDKFFNAKDIVIDSIVFAGTNPLRGKLEDVDNDNDLDLILHFDTQLLQLSPTDTEAVLTGQLNNGNLIKGIDSVRIVSK